MCPTTYNNMDISESKKEKAMQLFNEAWEDHKQALEISLSERVHGLEQENLRLKRDLEMAMMKISQLESEKAKVEEKMREMSEENSKYENLKAVLLDTLNESESPQKMSKTQNSVNHYKEELASPRSSPIRESEIVRDFVPETKTFSKPNPTGKSENSPKKKTIRTNILSPRRLELKNEFTESSSSKIVDGKKFFAEARNRLSFENFNKFLGYVKKLNDKAIDSNTAVIEVRGLFGDENTDLYQDFAVLVSKKNK